MIARRSRGILGSRESSELSGQCGPTVRITSASGTHFHIIITIIISFEGIIIIIHANNSGIEF